MRRRFEASRVPVLYVRGVDKTQVPKYDHLIIHIYDDWDTFIEKTGGLNISEAQGEWYPADK